VRVRKIQDDAIIGDAFSADEYEGVLIMDVNARIAQADKYDERPQNDG
jgi:hypothetical protein